MDDKHLGLLFAGHPGYVPFASEGLAHLSKKVKDHSEIGFIDVETLDFVIPPQFKKTWPFSDGLAAVCDRNGKWGYVDKQGEWVIGPQFYETFPFSEGLALFHDSKSGCGYINKAGDFIVPAQFKAGGPFSHGLAPVQEKSDYRMGRYPQWGFINTEGEFVIPPQFKEADSFCQGFAAVGVETQYGYNAFVDLSGQIVIPPKFHSVKRFSGGLAKVEVVEPDPPKFTPWSSTRRRLSRFINKAGDFAFEESFVAEAESFSEGLARVRSKEYGEEYGYIDMKGKWVFPPRFFRAKTFSEGIAAIHAPTYYQIGLNVLVFMDRAGRVLAGRKPKLGVDCFWEVGPFRCGVAAVLTGEEYPNPEWKYIKKPAA